MIKVRTRIAIAGTGYVGLSNVMLLAQHNDVVAIDIVPEKVTMLNNKQSPIFDAEIENFLANKTLSFTATLNKQEMYQNAKFVIFSTLKNYNPNTEFFNTSSVESIIQHVLVV